MEHCEKVFKKEKIRRQAELLTKEMKNEIKLKNFSHL